MPGSSLFTPEAIATLRAAQLDAMPHTAYVLTRTVAKEAGGIARQAWALARNFPCRISGQTADERADDSRRQNINSNALSYPVTEAPLDGSELVIVVGDGTHGDRAFTRLFRILGAAGEKSFETRRVATLTTSDVPRDVDPDDYLP